MLILTWVNSFSGTIRFNLQFQSQRSPQQSTSTSLPQPNNPEVNSSNTYTQSTHTLITQPSLQPFKPFSHPRPVSAPGRPQNPLLLSSSNVNGNCVPQNNISFSGTPKPMGNSTTQSENNLDKYVSLFRYEHSVIYYLNP